MQSKLKKNLVLLNGWGFSKKVWEDFIPYLSSHFQVTCLNLHGSNLDLMTQYILENSPKSASFLGWSLGGLVAMNIAISFPERVRKLITIASTPKFIASGNWPGMAMEEFEQFEESLKNSPKNTLKKFVVLQFSDSRVHRDSIEFLQNSINENNVDSNKLQESLSILKNVDLTKKLFKIQCPQLYLYGDSDALVPAGVAKCVENLTQNATVKLFPQLGHSFFLTHPTLCANIIRDFCYDVN